MLWGAGFNFRALTILVDEENVEVRNRGRGQKNSLDETFRLKRVVSRSTVVVVVTDRHPTTQYPSTLSIILFTVHHH